MYRAASRGSTPGSPKKISPSRQANNDVAEVQAHAPRGFYTKGARKKKKVGMNLIKAKWAVIKLDFYPYL